MKCSMSHVLGRANEAPQYSFLLTICKCNLKETLQPPSTPQGLIYLIHNLKLMIIFQRLCIISLGCNHCTSYGESIGTFNGGADFLRLVSIPLHIILLVFVMLRQGAFSQNHNKFFFTLFALCVPCFLIIDQSEETKLVAPSIEKLPTAVSFCAQTRHWRHRSSGARCSIPVCPVRARICL